MRDRVGAVIAAVAGALFVVVSVAPVWADEQSGASASLRVTVQDETEAALVGAVVTVVDAAGVSRDSAADGRGVATFADLVPGTYQVTVMADGFRNFVGTANLRRGVNQTKAQLAVALQEAIFVNDESADQRRDNGFTTTLTQEEIDALSDDPDEMAEQLQQMAGAGSQIFVDGFGGGRLPPKDQIQRIQFHTNSYSAQYHDAGMIRIDVITKPGMGRWRGNFNVGFRDESLNARNAKAPVRGAEQQKRFMVSFQGPLAKGKTSLSIRADGNAAYDSRTIVATTPDGQINEQTRRPTDTMNVNVRVDHAIGPGAQLQAEYFRRNDTRDNLGVGDFDLQERAYGTESVTDTFRLRNTKLIGKKAFSELKVQFSNTDTSQSSITDAPTVRVLDFFTSGGAGMTGSRLGRQLEIEQNLDFTIAKHTLRAGVLFEGGWWDSTQQSNANGTFTFSSLEDFLAGRARTYTRRVGDPDVSYSQYEAGWYLQDDFKLRKNLAMSLGLRQEVQTNMDDGFNLAPRAAVTWTVAKANIRAGYGIFYDWFESSVYEQTVRLDGLQQIEEVIVNPTYPDPGLAGGSSLPPSRIQVADDLTQPTIQQASIGFDRQLTPIIGLRADYMWTRGTNTLRSVNVNAPLADGTRPDPSAGNVSEIRSDGRRATDRITAGVNFRVPNARFFGTVMYNWSNTRNFADSPLSLPADSNNPDADWGPAAQDVRHRMFILANAPLLYGIRAGLNVQASSALPYNITTGTDDNGDTVFNDRPEDVSRNSARGAAQWNVGLRLNRQFNLGGLGGGENGPMPIGGPPQAAAQRGPGGGGPGGPGGGPGGEGGGPQLMMMQASNARYRLDLHVQVFNLLNTTNLNAFVGNLLSPYYGTATSAATARRLEVGATLFF
jgi:hypothetical protein